MNLVFLIKRENGYPAIHDEIMQFQASGA